MRGSCGRYLMLKASFIPLMFLSVFTFYIALLWILPYMVMTEAMFYRDLMGELTAEKEEEERAAQDYVNPIFGGTDPGRTAASAAVLACTGRTGSRFL